jgi:hypothetical protein
MGVLNNSMWNVSTAGGSTFLDAGVYADDSDGYNTITGGGSSSWKRQTISFWYRNDYANTDGTFMYGGYHGSQDFGGTFVGGDGYVYHSTKYNNSFAHNVKSSSTLSTAQRAINTWHHFCLRMPASGTAQIHIDGTEMLTFTANDYTDAFGRYHGYLPNPGSYPVSTLSGSPSWDFQGCTYMAQLVVTSGSSPHAVTDVLDSGDAVDVQDTDGNGTDLVTDRAGRSGGSGFWLFGANGTTSSLTHNSASDGQGDGSFASSDFALSTSSSIFPVTSITS